MTSQRRLKIYLDTSVINFLFAEDAPELRAVTLELFRDYVAPKKYDVYVSEVVVAEIHKTPERERQRQLLDVVMQYGIPILPFTTEADKLADTYVREGVISPRHYADAQHVAIATCSQIDVLLSWNFKHLANIKRQIAVRIVNEREGYFYPLALVSPMEVQDVSD